MSRYRSLFLLCLLASLPACGEAPFDDEAESEGDLDEESAWTESAEEGLAIRIEAPGDGEALLMDGREDEPTPSEFPICPDCQSRGAVTISRDAYGRITSFNLRVYSARTRLTELMGDTAVSGHELVIYQGSTEAARIPLGGLSYSSWKGSDGVRLYPSSVSATALSSALRNPANYTSGTYTFHVSLSAGGGRIRMPVPRGF